MRRICVTLICGVELRIINREGPKRAYLLVGSSSLMSARAQHALHDEGVFEFTKKRGTAYVRG
jgi:hypothetical protein